jgi:hypothetical protein
MADIYYVFRETRKFSEAFPEEFREKQREIRNQSRKVNKNGQYVLITEEDAKKRAERTFTVCKLSGAPCMGFATSAGLTTTFRLCCSNCNIPLLYPEQARQLLSEIK